MKNIFCSAIIGLPSLLLTLTINRAPAIAQFPGELTPISATKQTENSPTHRKLDQGRIYFNAGKYAQAAQIWQQAANNYEKSGDTLNQALSLSYLSLAYQHLSQWEAAQTAIESSVNLVESNKSINAFEWAQILNTQAKLFFHTGNHQSALTGWEKAQNYYQQAGDETGVLMSQINQAQALQGLGFYNRSKTLLENLNQQLADTEDSLIKISALRSLGINLRLVGDLTTSQEILDQSLAIAENLGNETQMGITWL
jgi:tetratricopeptide (TPR) repeat protein